MTLLGHIIGLLLFIASEDSLVSSNVTIQGNNYQLAQSYLSPPRCKPVSVRVKKAKKVCFNRIFPMESSEWDQSSTGDSCDQSGYEDRAEFVEITLPGYFGFYFCPPSFPDQQFGFYQHYLSSLSPPPQLG